VSTPENARKYCYRQSALRTHALNGVPGDFSTLIAGFWGPDWGTLGRLLPFRFLKTESAGSSEPVSPTATTRRSPVGGADSVTCVVRCTRNTYGDRCFAAAGPRVWNSLPAELRQCDSLGQFKRHLKSYLFGIWDHGAFWLLVRQRRIEIPLLTYLPLTPTSAETFAHAFSLTILFLKSLKASYHTKL